jgi:hypothetical protein
MQTTNSLAPDLGDGRFGQPNVAEANDAKDGVCAGGRQRKIPLSTCHDPNILARFALDEMGTTFEVWRGFLPTQFRFHNGKCGDRYELALVGSACGLTARYSVGLPGRRVDL